MNSPHLDFSFDHSWSAEILSCHPLISPARQVVYPKQAEDIERGALDIMVRPSTTTPFLATFALGFADPAAPTGLWSCPDPDWLCAVAGGYAYVVNTREPEHFEQIEYRPVLHVRALTAHHLLIFAGHHALLAWDSHGKLWQTQRLSSEGIAITRIAGDYLEGIGWDLITDRDVHFVIDLRTGTQV